MSASANMEVTCPKCGKRLLLPVESAGKKGQCPYCSEIFSLPVSTVPVSSWNRKPTSVVHAASPIVKGKSAGMASAFMSLRSALIIAIAIVVVGLAYCISNYMGSRYQLDVLDKKTYRLDRHTGRMSIINSNGMVVEVTEPIIIKNRDLSYTETDAIEGWAGMRYETSGFGGSFYNGNKDIVVTEVNICLSYTNESRTVKRIYKSTHRIDPLETAEVYFNIVNPGRDLMFSGWHVDSAKGHALSDESDAN